MRPLRFTCLCCLLLSTTNFVAAVEPPNFQPSSMAYVLQVEGLGKREAAIEALAKCDRDLVVMDYAYYGDDESKWTRDEVERIRKGKPGRRVVAYYSIGEAGTYRAYWQKQWDANGDGKPDENAPSWLLESNPDWPDNYKVRFWDRTWQKLMLSYLDEILAQSFDGVYLDIVDAFEYFEHDRKNDKWLDHRPNPQTGNTYRQDMIAWVRMIAARGRKANSRFLVIPQNGVQLLESTSYLNTVDGVGVEDLFTHGNRRQKADDSRYRLNYLQHAIKSNTPVLLIEYSKKEKARAYSIEQARKHKLRLLITDRPLKTLGTWPLVN